MTTQRVDLASFLEMAHVIAEEAGRSLMGGYRKSRRGEDTGIIRKKGAIDLVTEWDMASEKLICSRLASAFPNIPVLAEEGGGASLDQELVWVVDPIDGTTNFAHGHPFFSVSIGLARRGRPILGVVHAPALGITWRGAEGKGSTRHARGQAEPERCVLGRAQSLRDALVATGFPYDRATSDENNIREMSRVVTQVRGIRRCGSAAIDLCLVADGTYDAYWEQKLAPWDLCGGAAIVFAAGGVLTDYEGGEIDLKVGRVVASNGMIHDDLREEIVAARMAPHP